MDDYRVVAADFWENYIANSLNFDAEMDLTERAIAS